MSVQHQFYPSVAAALAMTKADWNKADNADMCVKRMTIDKGTGNTNWFGIDAGGEAVTAMLTDGYPVGEQRLREFHDAIAAHLPRAVGVNRAIVRGAFGDELDVHAVNRGQLDRAWTSSKRRVKQGNSILRLVVDICGNGDTSADALQWRGIAGLSLAEVMTKAGYSVEIIASMGVCNFTGYNNSQMTASIVVKPRTAQPDYGLLAATVALPGFFRTIGFACIIRAADDMKKECFSGLGNYLDLTGILPVPDKVTQLIVPGSVQSRQTATDWVKQSVALLQGARA